MEVLGVAQPRLHIGMTDEGFAAACDQWRKDIKAAYRAQAMLNHPDKGGTSRNFQTIRAAYDRLLEVRPVKPRPTPHGASQHSDRPDRAHRKMNSATAIRCAFCNMRRMPVTPPLLAKYCWQCGAAYEVAEHPDFGDWFRRNYGPTPPRER